MFISRNCNSNKKTKPKQKRIREGGITYIKKILKSFHNSYINEFWCDFLFVFQDSVDPKAKQAKKIWVFNIFCLQFKTDL